MRQAQGNDVMVRFFLTEEERTPATDEVRQISDQHVHPHEAHVAGLCLENLLKPGFWMHFLQRGCTSSSFVHSYLR